MDYVYDIVLNFQNDYYDFYEWKTSDKIINIKKIPIYKISNKDYLNIKNNSVTIDRKSLDSDSKMFLLTGGIEVMGILINNKGRVIKKSSLLFDEADDILEDRNEINNIDIKYHVDRKNSVKYISRNIKEKSKYINDYFKYIDKTREEYFLKYLYYDIFNREEDNIDIVYNKLIELSKKDVLGMYNNIKKIELELKK